MLNLYLDVLIVWSVKMEKYDLFKVPDEVIIRELKLEIKQLKIESGKDKSYIQELEEIVSKVNSYKKKLLESTIELNHLLQTQEELRTVIKEFRSEKKFESRYNKLRIEFNDVQRQLTSCLRSKIKT